MRNLNDLCTLRKLAFSGAIVAPRITRIEDADTLNDKALVCISGKCWMCQRHVRTYFTEAASVKNGNWPLVSCQVGGCSRSCRTRGKKS